MNIEKKLENLGLVLPEAPKPIAEYIPAKKVDNFIFCSGQGPIKNGSFLYVGRVGDEVSLEEGYESAKLCTLNSLAAIKTVLGTLDDIEEIVKVKGYVNSSLNFTQQPQVINGASDLLVKIFGEKGRHSRSALGTSVLPDNIPVELELIVKVK